MPLSIQINAPIKDVYDTLNDPTKNGVWNPVTQEVTETAPGQCTVKSFMGEFTTTRTVSEPNKEVRFTIKGSVLTEMSYKLERISENVTRVDGSVKFAVEYSTMHEKVGSAMLENLKKYVEHLQSGGTDANFQKE